MTTSFSLTPCTRTNLDLDSLGSNTGSDCQLELLGLFEKLSSEVSRVERGGNQDLSLGPKSASVTKSPHDAAPAVDRLTS